MTTNNKENVMLEQMKKEIQMIRDLWWLIQYDSTRNDEWMAAYWEQQTTIQREFIENIFQ